MLVTVDPGLPAHRPVSLLHPVQGPTLLTLTPDRARALAVGAGERLPAAATGFTRFARWEVVVAEE